MLLGSPPDMVHGALSHRTRISAYQSARLPCFITRQLYHIRPRVASRNPFPFPPVWAALFRPCAAGQSGVPTCATGPRQGGGPTQKKRWKESGVSFPHGNHSATCLLPPGGRPFFMVCSPRFEGAKDINIQWGSRPGFSPSGVPSYPSSFAPPAALCGRNADTETSWDGAQCPPKASLY